MKKTTVMILIMMAQLANAGWTNWPLSVNNTNAYDWELCRTNFYQLIYALNERCIATEDIFLLSFLPFVNNYTVPAGYTNAIIVTNGVTFTNRILCYTNVSCTNLSIRTYTYSDAEGSHTATAFPWVIQSQIAYIDQYISDCIPFFVATNRSQSGNFTTWFDRGETTNKQNNFPFWTKAELFTHRQIGFVTNFYTNCWGITNGDAYFTRYPLTTNQWLIFETSYVSNWNTNTINNKGLKYYENIPPVAIYHLGGSETQKPLSFTFYGEEIVRSNQSLTSVNETVSISLGTTALTKIWYSITNVTVSGNAANTGDVLSIVYTNPHAVYGDFPYQILAQDLDERWKVLDSLVWTAPSFSDFGGPNGYQMDGTGGTWTVAKSAADGASVESGVGGKAHKATYGVTNLYAPYFAGISWGPGAFTIQAPLTNFTSEQLFYTRAVSNNIPIESHTPTNQVWSIQGDESYGFGSNGFYAPFWTNFYPVYGSPIIGYSFGDSNNTIASYEWCDDPATISQTKGYMVDSILRLHKWNTLTNGFVWK